MEPAWNFPSHFELLCTMNVFAQSADNPAFAGFNAQQTKSVLSVSYSL